MIEQADAPDPDRAEFSIDALVGLRALVTGGTSGIGKGISRALSGAGCAVIACGLGESEAAGMRVESPEVDSRVLDVTDSEAITRLVSGISRLDILINAAGTIRRGGAEFEPEAFAEVIDVNLVGMMRMCSACRPLLEASRGCIVNVASMLTFFGSGFAPAYSASKGGVAQLTKSLAIAWADQGIRVNAVAPGWIETPLTRPLLDDPSRRQAIVDRTPMKRWGKPEDVAGPVLFLCSPLARFVTGVVLPADGGYSIM